jgi:cryptochrome
VQGGEIEGLKRLDKYLAMETWVCEFEKPKGNPALFDPAPATTVLSPYMKFGCVSCRLFYHRLQQVYANNSKHTKPPVSLEGQLLWREFFYTVGFDTKNFDKVRGRARFCCCHPNFLNAAAPAATAGASSVAICPPGSTSRAHSVPACASLQMEGNPDIRQIPWDDNPEFFERWRNAQTGYPWIDAIMTQLRQWGWMHHLARHSVACFLTRGDLWVHWEKGRDVFDELLIDADHFINNGNWQVLHCWRGAGIAATAVLLARRGWYCSAAWRFDCQLLHVPGVMV